MLNEAAPVFEGIKHIGLFGLGRSNLAILEGLCGSDTEITLRSDKKIDRTLIPSGVKISAIYEGEAAFFSLSEQTLVLSPSVRRDRPELLSASERGVRLTSDAELFFGRVDAPVYAISGSDGKSTTSALTTLLLGGKSSGTALCGNVGEPMLPTLGRYSRYVTELSSFMLSYLTPVSKRAALTNITPNHLDWHRDFEEYKTAKLGIYKATDEPIINLDDRIIKESVSAPVFAAVTARLGYKEARSQINAELYYTLEDGYIKRCGEPYLAVDVIKRREAHSLKNLMLALALTDGCRLSDPIEVARNFGGLAHRCELVFRWRKIRFVDSSIDTSPARCATTLASLNTPFAVILGGRDKGVPFTPIKEALKNCRVAIIFGECREKIIEALPHALPYRLASDMTEAVELAASHAKDGDTVILSPAATSYDMYGSFEERGDDFKSAVKEYIKKHDI